MNLSERMPRRARSSSGTLGPWFAMGSDKGSNEVQRGQSDGSTTNARERHQGSSHSTLLAALKQLLLLAALMSGGCGSILTNLSAGAIGCPSEAITVHDKHKAVGVVSWAADCRGRTFYCSYNSVVVNCKESLAAPSAARAATRPALESIPRPQAR